MLEDIIFFSRINQKESEHNELFVYQVSISKNYSGQVYFMMTKLRNEFKAYRKHNLQDQKIRMLSLY